MTGRPRGAAGVTVALLAVGMVISSCSSGSSSSRPASTSEVKPQRTSSDQVAKRFAAIRKDPCQLLSIRQVKGAFSDADVRRVHSGSVGACRYRLGEGRTLELDLYQPQSKRSLQDRTRGTFADGTARSLRLDTPGTGLLVSRGSSLALLTLRASSDPTATGARPAVQQLAKTLAKALPSAPPPGRTLRTRDLCDVVASTALVKGLEAGDARTADDCAYRHPDGTLIRIHLGAEAAPEATISSGGAPWPEAGAGARWLATGTGTSGAGAAFVPVDGLLLEVTLTSPVRSSAALQAIALKAVKQVRAAG